MVEAGEPEWYEVPEGAVIRSRFPRTFFGRTEGEGWMPRSYDEAKRCEVCGEACWGPKHRRTCSSSCRSRRNRLIKARAPLGLEEVAREILTLKESGSAAYSRLLPHLFREVAAELRRRGWNPIELLLTIPDEPVGESELDHDGSLPARKWLRPPEQELENIERLILERQRDGRSTEWHFVRREELRRALGHVRPPR